MKKKKIFVAMPYKRYVEPETEETLTDFIYRPSDIYEVTHTLRLRGSPNIYNQRYNSAMEFLKTDCDYYFYLDSDQQILAPENAVDLLVNDNYPIVSPLIVRTLYPHLPATISMERYNAKTNKQPDFFEDFRKDIYPKGSPFRVYRCCGGVVLIKREVLEMVDRPFYPVFDENGDLLGTDYSLYYKAEMKGFYCYIEPRIKVAHIGHYPYCEDDYYGLLDCGMIKKTA